MRLICALNNISSRLTVLEGIRIAFWLRKWARKCPRLSGQGLIFQGPSTSSRCSNAGGTPWETKGSWRSSWDLFQSGLDFYHSVLLWDILQSPWCKAGICTLKKMLVEKECCVWEKQIFSKYSENKTCQHKRLKPPVQGPCCRSPISQQEPNLVPEVWPGWLTHSTKCPSIIPSLWILCGKQQGSQPINLCYNMLEDVYRNDS